jgi:hypothetical protein
MHVEMGDRDACTRVDELWFEILAPVEGAQARIQQALEGVVLPAGLSVAKSERGTLLLNAKAWATFHVALRPLSLQMQHPALRVGTQVLQYCLRT